MDDREAHRGEEGNSPQGPHEGGDARGVSQQMADSGDEADEQPDLSIDDLRGQSLEVTLRSESKASTPAAIISLEEIENDTSGEQESSRGQGENEEYEDDFEDSESEVKSEGSKGQGHQDDDDEDNIGSVSDSEHNISGEPLEGSFKQAPPQNDRSHSNNTDELLTGFRGDGDSIVSDIFTDIAGMQLTRKGQGRQGGKVKDTNISPGRDRYDSLRSPYTRPRAYPIGAPRSPYHAGPTQSRYRPYRTGPSALPNFGYYQGGKDTKVSV